MLKDFDASVVDSETNGALWLDPEQSGGIRGGHYNGVFETDVCNTHDI